MLYVQYAFVNFEDSLLASFSKQDTRCQTCKSKLGLTGVTCPHCNRRFCMTDAFPESHGCGEAARKAARAGRAALPKPTVNQDRKKQLQRKLDKKIGEMEQTRARTAKKKDESMFF